MDNSIKQKILEFCEGCLWFLPDKQYISLKYRLKMHKKMNWKNPRTFNEKLQVLKLQNHNPLYTRMADKYEVKSLVSKVIGPEYVIPTLGVWEKFEDIDFDLLPNQFVLKCTHDSGGLVICLDKTRFDIERAKKKICACLRRNYYIYCREWPYKAIHPRIIAEPYIEDAATNELRDYKFFCFDGVPKALFIATDRQKENEDTKFDFFDMEFRHLDIRNGHPNANELPAKPKNFQLMKELAGKLSEGIPHVRVDFYEVNGAVLFGELTFFHWGGMMPFEPEKWDRIFGDWIKLP